jgi:hypothetical protein
VSVRARVAAGGASRSKPAKKRRSASDNGTLSRSTATVPGRARPRSQPPCDSFDGHSACALAPRAGPALRSRRPEQPGGSGPACQFLGPAAAAWRFPGGIGFLQPALNSAAHRAGSARR